MAVRKRKNEARRNIVGRELQTGANEVQVLSVEKGSRSRRKEVVVKHGKAPTNGGIGR